MDTNDESKKDVKLDLDSKSPEILLQQAKMAKTERPKSVEVVVENTVKSTSSTPYKRITTAGPGNYSGSSASKPSTSKSFVPQGFGSSAKFELPAGRERRHTVGSAMDQTSSAKYSYERLKQKPLPGDVDATHLEMYLEDNDFERLFGMPVREFIQMPAWKQDGKKKQVGLY